MSVDPIARRGKTLSAWERRRRRRRRGDRRTCQPLLPPVASRPSPPLGRRFKGTRWSVSRVLFRLLRDGDDHSSRPAIAGRLSRPTRTLSASDGLVGARPTRGPYSVLLQAGLAMPSLSPGPRWALTPPFHPYRPRTGGGLLSVALSLGSLPVGVTHRLVTVEPGLSSASEDDATARPSGPGVQ